MDTTQTCEWELGRGDYPSVAPKSCADLTILAMQVVLPAVAKKKGLQDQYETADGSPKPKDEVVVIEPVSTFFRLLRRMFLTSCLPGTRHLRI